MLSFYHCVSLAVVMLTVLSASLDGPALLAAAPTTQPADEAPPPSSKFLRFVPGDHAGGTLQASVVRYVNDDGVVVDLVAAVHIAEPSFFKALDESFEDYDAVLYEMVAPQSMLEPTTQPGDGASAAGGRRLSSATRPAGEQPRRSRALNMVGTLQRFLRDTLKLSFQLEAIDYRRPNFIHADLDAETFQQMQSDRGESFVTILLNSMLRQMSNPTRAMNQPGLGDILLAMRSPDRARQLKLMLARQFEQIDEQMAGMEGPKGSVILSERNKAAMKVLREQLAAGQSRTLAIFYGAGHLKGMEEILTKEMGFRQVGPPFWRVAWDMTMNEPPTTQPATQPAATTTTQPARGRRATTPREPAGSRR